MFANRGNGAVLAGKEHSILVIEGEWILNNIYKNLCVSPSHLGAQQSSERTNPLSYVIDAISLTNYFTYDFLTTLCNLFVAVITQF